MESVSETVLHDIFSRTADAVFAIDSQCEIIYRNQPFTDIFQLPASALPHQKCYELVCGRKLEKKSCCDPNCPVGKSMLNGQVTENFKLTIPQNDDAPLDLSIVTFPVHRLLGKDAAVVMLRPMGASRDTAHLADSVKREDEIPADIDGKLTRRERQILNLLAKGFDARALASTLHISHVTARNHVQHIYAKLDIHSRAEAVSYVFRHGLMR